jgi:hypothetical protein
VTEASGQDPSTWGIPQPDAWPRRLGLRRVLALILAFTLVLGLGLVSLRDSMFPGSGVADRIRAAGSNLVVKVDFREGTPIVGILDAVDVYLRHGTTEAEANAFGARSWFPPAALLCPGIRWCSSTTIRKPAMDPS